MYELLDSVKFVADDEIRYGIISNIKDDTYTIYVEIEKKMYEVPGKMILDKHVPVKKMTLSQRFVASIYAKRYARFGALCIIIIVLMLGAALFLKSFA